MSKMITALLLATTIATPALAEKGGKGHGGGHGRPEQAGPRHGGGGPAHVARAQPRHQDRAQMRFERRVERRAAPRVERIREVREVRGEQRRSERLAIKREQRRPDVRVAAFRPDKPQPVKVAREAPRNWGQVRSAIAHRDNAERRWERQRERAVRSVPVYAVREAYVPSYRTVSYAYPAYRTAYAAPSYQAVRYSALPYSHGDVPYGYADAPYYDGGYDGGGFDFGSIAGAVLPLLLGNSLGDLGGLGSGLLGGPSPTYAAADPYGYDPYADGYGYADPYETASYDAGYSDDALGLGSGGSLGTLASLALGSGILGGGSDLLGGLSGFGGLGGASYADPFGTSPEALLAQSLGGLAA